MDRTQFHQVSPALKPRSQPHATSRTELHPRPRVVVSECLGFEACRHNGQIIRDDFVSALRPHVDFVKICPEVAIGLGTPREALRLVERKWQLRMVQPATGKDFTHEMESFATEYLKALGQVDGFILKGRSPSCGVKDAKRYPLAEKCAPAGRGPGVFGARVLDLYPGRAIEDEGRLRDDRIRAHFLTQLYTLARFRELEKNPTRADLIAFHAAHKLLLLAYNQKEMRNLGGIVGAMNRREIREVFADYRAGLERAMSRMPRHRSHLNVLEHAVGYFSDEVSVSERNHFTHLLGEFAEGRVPLSVPASVLRSWTERFDSDYLRGQVYFAPYPRELAINRQALAKGLLPA